VRRAAALAGVYRRGSGITPACAGSWWWWASSPAVVGITPACAGSMTVADRILVGIRDQPRKRGERWLKMSLPLPASGAPRRSRGAGGELAPQRRRAGITPAYAGSTVWTQTARQWRHGSPLHVLGAHTPAGVGEPVPAITPRAGSRSGTNSVGLWGGDHPRVRGEHSMNAAVSFSAAPRRAGAIQWVVRWMSVGRLIPPAQ